MLIVVSGFTIKKMDQGKGILKDEKYFNSICEDIPQAGILKPSVTKKEDTYEY